MNTSKSFDLVIRNGRIIDGSGNVWYRADIGVRDGLIVAIGKLDGSTSQVIDAHDLIVCPGFVDTLTGANIAVLGEPLNKARTTQGITSIHVGLCGNSTVPLTDKTANSLRQYLTPGFGDFGIDWDWRTVNEYLDRISGKAAVNVCASFGITNLWVEAVGWEDRRATPAELERMKQMAVEAMEDGAVGFSTGTYAPTEWSTHEECVEIAKMVAKYGGVYFSHVRNISGDDPFAGFKEAIAVGEEAGIPVHIEHFKTFNKAMYHRADELLAFVDNARARGQDVTLDSYPYTAGSGGFWPASWAHVGGPEAMLARLKNPVARKKIAEEFDQQDSEEWEGRYIVSAISDKYKWCEGMLVKEAATAAGKGIGDFLCEFMLENKLAVQHISHGGCEEDIRKIMQHPAHMVCSDSIHIGKKLHPRTYGCYARYLGRYVRELGILKLEQCIRMMTSLPARRLGLMDRGLLRIGLAADITIFDPETIIDKATFEEPRQYAEGVEHVIVNGKIIIKDRKHTGALPGRGLKRHPRC